jgi:hypothetical protein
MIKTVAQLLKELVDKNLPILASQKVQHAPTIGDMYEGLSAEVLRLAIPADIPLQVVTGFVTDGLGRRSGQLDCMLVTGKGEPIPFTNSHVWHVADVIAVVEVKKTLLGTEFTDAYSQLASVREMERSYWRSGSVSVFTDAMFQNARKTYRRMTGRDIPQSFDVMSVGQATLFESLMACQASIARIMLGFNVFKQESSFRTSAATYLGSHIGEDGYGPNAFPNLVISGQYSLIKTDGRPYLGPMTNGYWPFVCSSRHNPLLLLLEVVWTRLSERFAIEGLWGDDLEHEVLTPLLSGAPDDETAGAWRMTWTNWKEARLKEGNTQFSWEPAHLTDEQAQVLLGLNRGSVLRLSDAILSELADSDGVALEEFVDGLLKTSLVALDGDRFIIATNYDILFLPSGEIVAGDNSTGRLGRWAARTGAFGPLVTNYEQTTE